MESKKYLVILILLGFLTPMVTGTQSTGTYENSLVIAPLYDQYLDVSADVFAREAQQLKSQLGTAPYVKIGFAGFLIPQFPDIPLDRALTDEDLAADLARIDLMVDRAREQGIVSHVSLVSGFFHGQNQLRFSAIRQDVRNAQWFADGWIADPAKLTGSETQDPSMWITPSRYAEPLHSRIEEGIRILARRLASNMQRFPDTLLTISGDGEVEFTFERNFGSDGERSDDKKEIIWADYSPFMIAEFRDWIRSEKYDGDLSPATDDNGDGHTFNGDFGQSFATWKLRYFNDSGPIPLEQYLQLPEKLPSSGPYAEPGGFDAPRTEAVNDVYWMAWMRFREYVIANWVRDFAVWMTTSADPDTGFTIPPSHVYSHQIPGDFIFGQSANTRLKTSASPVSTAMTEPAGSTGVTAFNGFDGNRHIKTATPALFSALFMSSDNWGILEYNPSVPYSNNIPPSADLRYYINELRTLHIFRPHLIVPFVWSEEPLRKSSSIQNSVFARALHDFIGEVGRSPWYSWRAALR